MFQFYMFPFLWMSTVVPAMRKKTLIIHLRNVIIQTIQKLLKYFNLKCYNAVIKRLYATLCVIFLLFVSDISYKFRV